MALVLGTNSGFVITAPTADPAGADTVIDGASVVTKHTSPVGANKITEIGWYRGSGTNTSNFEIALYASDGIGGIAGTRLYVDATNSSSSAGWIATAVDWNISENTVYWLAVQMDAHSGSSNIDTATTNGVGYDRMTSQTTLANPYGGGTVDSATGMYAIYAKVSIARNITIGLGSLLFTAFAATVFATNSININAGIGTLALTGYTPTATITNNIQISPNVGVITFNGSASVITATVNKNIDVGYGELVLSGYAPTAQATNHKNITPDIGVLTLTGFASTAFAGDNKNIPIDLGELTLAGQVSIVFTSDIKNIQTDVGELLLSGEIPIIVTTNHINISSGLGELLLTGLTPILSTTAGTIINPDIGNLILTGFAPVITGTGNGALMKYWDGAGWKNITIKIFMSTWELKPIKRWTGIEWILIDNN